LVNSRQGRFSATPTGSTRKVLHPPGHSFSRSYGVMLPSSLTRVLPIALVYSTRPPVSVFGTGTWVSLEVFLGSRAQPLLARRPAFTPRDQVADLPTTLFSLRDWHLNPIRGWPTPLRHPFAQSTRRGTGMLTCCPSPTTFVLGLGPTNPTRTNLPSETLGLRRTRFSRVSRYSCRHSLFRSLQQSSRSAFYAGGTLPYCLS
jgi:hypothetical protein